MKSPGPSLYSTLLRYLLTNDRWVFTVRVYPFLTHPSFFSQFIPIFLITHLHRHPFDALSSTSHIYPALSIPSSNHLPPIHHSLSAWWVFFSVFPFPRPYRQPYRHRRHLGGVPCFQRNVQFIVVAIFAQPAQIATTAAANAYLNNTVT